MEEKPKGGKAKGTPDKGPDVGCVLRQGRETPGGEKREGDGKKKN